jgi:hypothetical protein
VLNHRMRQPDRRRRHLIIGHRSFSHKWSLLPHAPRRHIGNT